MRRNIGHEIVRNYGSWWMDLYGTGWFEDASLWKQHSLFKKAEIDMIKNPQVYKPDSALVYDEQSMCYIGLNSAHTTGVLMRGSNIVVGRTGTPWGYYLLDDVLDMENPPKLVSLLCAVPLTMKSAQKSKNFPQNPLAYGYGHADTSMPQKENFRLKPQRRRRDLNSKARATFSRRRFPQKKARR